MGHFLTSKTPMLRRGRAFSSFYALGIFAMKGLEGPADEEV
jgi:hypothetical protein